jgi:hypothetical protein
MPVGNHLDETVDGTPNINSDFLLLVLLHNTAVIELLAELLPGILKNCSQFRFLIFSSPRANNAASSSSS